VLRAINNQANNQANPIDHLGLEKSKQEGGFL
jgi:hypothetical protein